MWTYEQRMERAIRALVDSDILDSSASEVRHRPRFFNKYGFRISVSPTPDSWIRFDDLKQRLHDKLDSLGANIIANRSTYDFHIYGNEPSIIRWFLTNHSAFYVNSVIQTHKDSWSKPMPKTNRKGKFFDEFMFRIKMKQRDWGTEKENVDQLLELGLHHKLVCRKFSNSVTPICPEGVIRDTFVYVDKLNEVLVLKLMFGDQVVEVEQRS